MVRVSSNTRSSININSQGSSSVSVASNTNSDINTNQDGNSQRARSWAVGQGLIDGEDYSAKHYAQEAKESEEIASHAIENIDTAKEQALSAIDTEKTEAIADMEIAKEEKIGEIEDTAADFEDDLEALTTRAETAATNAETSETNAAASATRAESEATTAYTSASAANFSKNAAAASATSAATNANLALDYKNDAQTAASNADSYRLDAVRAADAAARSSLAATDAATRATQAQTIAESARDAAENYAQQAEDAKDNIEAELDNYVPNTRKVNNKPLSTDITLTASDVGALANTTKYGYSIALSLDTTDYKLTLTLKDQDGTALSTKTVDFPIESVVVNGSYNSANKKIVLTLQNGNTIDIPVGDLISGLQSEITSTNMLDSDLVDDTNSTHKFVSTNEKTTWNNKQNAITDLSTIRTNATNGANAYTTIQGYGDIVTHNASEFVTPSRLTTVLADYVLSSDLSTTLADYVTSTNLTTILDDYATKQWTQTNANALYSAIQTWVQNQGYALSSNLATVATSGSYNDLSNKPTIPAAQVQADWDVTDTTSKAYIKNKPYIPSGVVVDQTYDGTSTNAQSGVAIAGAGFLTSIPSNYLQNIATGTNSVAILTANNKNYTMCIGYNVSTVNEYSIAIGNRTAASGVNCLAVGYEAKATGLNGCTAIGYSADATGKWSTAIGDDAQATKQGATSLGFGARATGQDAVGVGYYARATADNSIQIGYGTNSVANTLSVGFYYGTGTHYNWQLLDGTTGLIPDARISSNIARTSDLSGYVQASNGNMTFANAGTEGDILYTNSTTGEFYGVIIGQSSTYGTGVTIGAGNSLAQNGYMLNLSLNGLGLIDASNMGTAVLTVSNNNLAVNGSEIATQSDLSSLADTDLSNLSATGKKVIDGQWVYNKTQIANNTHLTTTAQTYDMSSYLPNDSYDYEVLLGGSVTSGSSSGNRGYVTLQSDISSYVELAYAHTRANATVTAYGNCIIAVGTGRTLTIVGITNPNNSTFNLSIEGYRRIGTNT